MKYVFWRWQISLVTSVLWKKVYCIFIVIQHLSSVCVAVVVVKHLQKGHSLSFSLHIWIPCIIMTLYCFYYDYWYIVKYLKIFNHFGVISHVTLIIWITLCRMSFFQRPSRAQTGCFKKCWDVRTRQTRPAMLWVCLPSSASSSICRSTWSATFRRLSPLVWFTRLLCLILSVTSSAEHAV